MKNGPTDDNNVPWLEPVPDESNNHQLGVPVKKVIVAFVSLLFFVMSWSGEGHQAIHGQISF